MRPTHYNYNYKKEKKKKDQTGNYSDPQTLLYWNGYSSYNIT